jgi:Putative 8-oxoguanine DNA glycosylase OGG-like protein
MSTFPDFAEWLVDVPNPISRDDARRLADPATPDGAVQVFLASMIWGYGPVGYGPWRTKRVLDSNAQAAERLAEVARTVVAGGALDGFRDMAAKPLKHLGVAFGTKYLYFVSIAQPGGHEAGSAIAPVLDDVVRRWIAANAGVQLRIHYWHAKDYERFLTLLDRWGAQLDLRRDEVEELIFRAQIGRDDSRLWGEEWAEKLAEGTPRADALEALQLLRDELSILPGDSAAVDEADPSLKEIARIIDRHSPA